MSDRERWTVYPLLFFCLALQVKDKLVPASVIEADRIKCNSIEAGKMVSKTITHTPLLVVEGAEFQRADGKAALRIGGSVAQGGNIELFGPDGKLKIKLGQPQGANSCVLGTFADEHTPLVLVDSESQSPRITLYAPPVAEKANPLAKVLITERHGSGFACLFGPTGDPHFVVTASVRQGAGAPQGEGAAPQGEAPASQPGGPSSPAATAPQQIAPPESPAPALAEPSSTTAPRPSSP